jgi:2-polyprenyl-3-methyl-5-hydroxy-6-metoxy-1,4-benzoquinol methylase
MIERISCPLCKADGGKQVFPYATEFNGVEFSYLGCTFCKTAFVSPHPDGQTLSKMYASEVYHDQHYVDIDVGSYLRSARLLQRYLAPEALVLDYGCGAGHFLCQLKQLNFTVDGVEFDPGATQQAAVRSGCVVRTVEEFHDWMDGPLYDAVHLGDVLEHVADPAQVLSSLLARMKPGGLLFVEGPLEQNPSPVYWASLVMGVFKKRTGRYRATFPPTHLFRTNAAAQRRFFEEMDACGSTLHWRVYESGWPYAGQGVVRDGLAQIAVAMGGWGLRDWRLGNRFEGIFQVTGAPSPVIARGAV